MESTFYKRPSRIMIWSICILNSYCLYTSTTNRANVIHSYYTSKNTKCPPVDLELD